MVSACVRCDLHIRIDWSVMILPWLPRVHLSGMKGRALMRTILPLRPRSSCKESLGEIMEEIVSRLARGIDPARLGLVVSGPEAVSPWGAVLFLRVRQGAPQSRRKSSIGSFRLHRPCSPTSSDRSLLSTFR